MLALAFIRSRSRLALLRSTPGIRFGIRFRVRLGCALSPGTVARRTALGRAALRSVVVYIPSRTLEVQARRRQRTFKHTTALGTLRLRLSAEVLYLFEFMTAFSAAIRIQRQGSLPPGEDITHCFHCIGRAAIHAIAAPPWPIALNAASVHHDRN